LLRAPSEVSETLATALTDLKANTRFCSTCWNITEDDPCPICQDQNRERSLIAVVEEPLDVLAVERTGGFNGLYHVLHGAISPVNGIGPEQLKVRELVKRVQDENVLEDHRRHQSRPGRRCYRDVH
jgi:recombination protein RecR